MSKFNHDCLFLIFEKIKDEVKTLHSCLLVNRLWCEAVVPILWRNPWKYCQNSVNYNSLYSTIISLLPSESKELLINNNIDLFPNKFPKPLINYARFIKSLNTYEIHYMIRWLILIDPRLKDYKLFLEQETWKMIMSQSQRLNHLSLNSGDDINKFYDFTGSKDSLSKLVTL